MLFRNYPPSDALKPYVEQYVCMRADGSTDIMTPPEDDQHFRNGHHVQDVFPSWGLLCFLINASARFDSKIADRDCVLIGPQTSSIEVETLSGWFELVMVQFKPGGIRAFIDADLMKTHETVYTASEMQDADLQAISELVQQLGATEAACREVDRFLCAHLGPKDPQRLQSILRTVDAAAESRCQISVSEMSGIACLSERQFSRSFREYVGLTPKEFLRMLRWHSSIRQLQMLARTKQPIDLQEIALRMGYYDLSHMAMEFRQIGCSTPANFRQLGIPLTESFTIFFA